MTVSQMRCFVAVGTSLSFTKAAAELFISQQVVSRQIANLEKELDIRLLDRTTKKVRLTEPGRVLYETWSRLLEENDRAVREAAALHTRQQEKLRVGIANVDSIVDMVSGGIDRFIGQYPDVELEYKVYSFSTLREMLLAGEVDLIISLATELIDITPIHMTTLRVLELSIILSRRHPLSGREKLGIKDLAGETLYFFSPAFSYDASDNLRQIFRREGVAMENVKYFDNVRNLELALLSGKGITITFDMILDNAAEHLIFHDISHYLDEDHESAVAAWQDGQNKYIKKFIDCIQNN